MIGESFGTVDACKKELAAAATSQFGSGWARLVLDGDKLKVVKTRNPESPINMGVKPLLTIDYGSMLTIRIIRTAVRTMSMPYLTN